MDGESRTFEMSISRNEFLRLLPGAVGGSSFEERDNVFVHAEAGRDWRMALNPLPARVLGILRLERHKIEWTFSGYSGEEIEAFLHRFEQQFRKGGG